MYAADLLFCGIFLNPTWSVQSAVQLHRLPEAGVHKAGVVNVGLVSVLLVSVCVALTSTSVTHSTAINPADTLVIVVSVACHSSTDHTPMTVEVEATNQDIGSQVALVSVQLEGVPKAHPDTR